MIAFYSARTSIEQFNHQVLEFSWQKMWSPSVFAGFKHLTANAIPGGSEFALPVLTRSVLGQIVGSKRYLGCSGPAMDQGRIAAQFVQKSSMRMRFIYGKIL